MDLTAVGSRYQLPCRRHNRARPAKDLRAVDSEAGVIEEVETLGPELAFDFFPEKTKVLGEGDIGVGEDRRTERASAEIAERAKGWERIAAEIDVAVNVSRIRLAARATCRIIVRPLS